MKALEAFEVEQVAGGLMMMDWGLGEDSNNVEVDMGPFYGMQPAPGGVGGGSTAWNPYAPQY